MSAKKKLTKAFLLFDQANEKDPNKEIINGKPVPKELHYSQLMSKTLEQFSPNASDALKLAARSQHICRWKIPRDSYPMDRIGYLKWREDLKKFHAARATEILEKVGYDESIITKVSFLLQKKKLKKDEETQTLEDVICLVFLAHYYEDFIKKHLDEKVISILQKTWRKMSKMGHKAALQLSFSERGLDLVQKAIA